MPRSPGRKSKRLRNCSGNSYISNDSSQFGSSESDNEPLAITKKRMSSDTNGPSSSRTRSRVKAPDPATELNSRRTRGATWPRRRQLTSFSVGRNRRQAVRGRNSRRGPKQIGEARTNNGDMSPSPDPTASVEGDFEPSRDEQRNSARRGIRDKVVYPRRRGGLRNSPIASRSVTVSGNTMLRCTRSSSKGASTAPVQPEDFETPLTEDEFSQKIQQNIITSSLDETKCIGTIPKDNGYQAYPENTPNEASDHKETCQLTNKDSENSLQSKVHLVPERTALDCGQWDVEKSRGVKGDDTSVEKLELLSVPVDETKFETPMASPILSSPANEDLSSTSSLPVVPDNSSNNVVYRVGDTVQVCFGQRSWTPAKIIDVDTRRKAIRVRLRKKRSFQELLFKMNSRKLRFPPPDELAQILDDAASDLDSAISSPAEVLNANDVEQDNQVTSVSGGIHLQSDGFSPHYSQPETSPRRQRHNSRRPGPEFQLGERLEVRDDHDQWYPAKIIAVNADDQKVRIHYEGWKSRYDRWYSMASPHLRPLTRTSSRKERKLNVTEFEIGNHVQARWTNGKLYPAEITRVNTDGTYHVVFTDGCEKDVLSCNLKMLSTDARPFKYHSLLKPRSRFNSYSRQKVAEAKASAIKASCEHLNDSPDRLGRSRHSRYQKPHFLLGDSRRGATKRIGMSLKKLNSKRVEHRAPTSALKVSVQSSSKVSPSASVAPIKRQRLLVGGIFQAKRSESAPARPVIKEISAPESEPSNAENLFKCFVQHCDKVCRKEKQLDAHLKHYHYEIWLKRQKRKDGKLIKKKKLNHPQGEPWKSPQSPATIVDAVPVKTEDALEVFEVPESAIDDESVKQTEIKQKEKEIDYNGDIVFDPRKFNWERYSLSTREEVIFCKCENNVDIGLMVQCEVCLTWQHSNCVGFVDEVEIPDRYVCWLCKESEMKYQSGMSLQTWSATGQLPALAPGIDILSRDQAITKAATVLFNKMKEFELIVLRVETLLHVVRDENNEKLLNLDNWITPYQDLTSSLTKNMDKLNDQQKATAVAVFGEHSYSTPSLSSLSTVVIDGIPIDVSAFIKQSASCLPEANFPLLQGKTQEQLFRMWNRIRLNRIVQQLLQKLMDTKTLLEQQVNSLMQVSNPHINAEVAYNALKETYQLLDSLKDVQYKPLEESAP